MVLSNLSANTAYGVQICAVFNGDFKRPEWPKVTTNGFSCSCVDPGRVARPYARHGVSVEQSLQGALRSSVIRRPSQAAYHQ